RVRATFRMDSLNSNKRIHLRVLYNRTLPSVLFTALHMNCHRFLVLQVYD
ncbi:hypothetical protein L9F63_018833, partial [Diploptera punctata]